MVYETVEIIQIKKSLKKARSNLNHSLFIKFLTSKNLEIQKSNTYSYPFDIANSSPPHHSQKSIPNILVVC